VNFIFSFHPIDDELPELEVSSSTKTGENYTLFDLCTGQSSRHVQGLSFQQEKSFTQTFSASDRVNVFNLHMGPNDPIWNTISSSTTNLHDDFLDPRFPEKFPFEKIRK